jgi:predicted ribosomally synthesized peptide with SipW-like signal peptide
MSKKKLKLSRRNMLAGLGTIGIASAGAGFGTWAAFSDTEEATTTFTAGKLDGSVGWYASYNGDKVGEGDQIEMQMDEENGPYLEFNLDDVKPGDYGSIVFEITVENNPAWVFSCLDFDNNDDNGISDPEDEVDNGDVKEAEVSANTYNNDTVTVQYGDGELADNLYVLPFYDSNKNSSFFDGGFQGSFNPTSQGATSPAYWDNATGSLVPRPLSEAVFSQLDQGTLGFNNDGETYTTPAPVNRRYAGCILLNGEQNGTNNEQGFSALQPGDTIHFGYDWSLPFNVGNEAQTDTIEIYFGFDFQQVRHNESPARPYISTPGYRAQGDPAEGDADNGGN